MPCLAGSLIFNEDQEIFSILFASLHNKDNKFLNFVSGVRMEEDIDRFLYGDESIQLQQPSVQPSLKNDEIFNENNDNNEDEDEDEFDVIIDGTNQDPSIKKQINLQNVQQTSTIVASSSNVPKLDLNTIPQLNGQSIYDIDLDSFEEKPWKKPGADINDYFNYGFNETSWKLYCQKQQQLRQENK